MFSLTQQSVQLGFLPPMRVVHTAPDERGQIYVPTVNWLLAAATLAAVVIFRSSDALAGAYGIAVSLLMAITTCSPRSSPANGATPCPPSSRSTASSS